MVVSWENDSKQGDLSLRGTRETVFTDTQTGALRTLGPHFENCCTRWEEVVCTTAGCTSTPKVSLNQDCVCLWLHHATSAQLQEVRPWGISGSRPWASPCTNGLGIRETLGFCWQLWQAAGGNSALFLSLKRCFPDLTDCTFIDGLFLQNTEGFYRCVLLGQADECKLFVLPKVGQKISVW